MKFIGAAITDTGIYKDTNQDSVCMKIAYARGKGQVAMVIVCDGIGGLEKGELASATVVRYFSEWFENKLSKEINKYSWKVLANEWKDNVSLLNQKILEYGKSIKAGIGTTMTALLVLEERYMVVHVGDSRVYKITDNVVQLTKDHTYVEKEIENGNITKQQALIHPKSNVLLQCVGASQCVEPQILFGNVSKNDVFIVCSDGFRHKISDKEIYDNFNYLTLKGKNQIEYQCESVINLIKNRQERDNISVVLLKADKVGE